LRLALLHKDILFGFQAGDADCGKDIQRCNWFVASIRIRSAGKEVCYNFYLRARGKLKQKALVYRSLFLSGRCTYLGAVS
jgi:hypothetical protein